MNPDILKNMIEILNMQILLKLSCRVVADTLNKQPFTLKSVSPIDTALFRQLVPPSYVNKVLNSQASLMNGLPTIQKVD